jgi:hypothetical protein
MLVIRFLEAVDQLIKHAASNGSHQPPATSHQPLVNDGKRRPCGYFMQAPPFELLRPPDLGMFHRLRVHSALDQTIRLLYTNLLMARDCYKGTAGMSLL